MGIVFLISNKYYHIQHWRMSSAARLESIDKMDSHLIKVSLNLMLFWLVSSKGRFVSTDAINL